MVESLILIQGEHLSEETLGGVSLMNAKQLVVGSVPGGNVVLHVAADSKVDLGKALLVFAAVPGAESVLTLAILNQ